ncbi:MAG TPA: glycosyltransferase family 1 protein [Gammaproteobacteria bacterium]
MHHVLIDCERMKQPNTGLYYFCRNLGLALLEQADASTEALHFYVPRACRGLFGDQVGYVVQRPRHKFFCFRTGRFNVWHSTYQLTRYKPYNSGTRVVLTIHDLNFLVERRDRPDKIAKYLARLQRNIDRASHVVCISEFTRDQVLEHLDLRGKPLDVIYNGCNIVEFPGFDAPRYRPQRPFLFTVGYVTRKKNFHVLPALLVDSDLELVIGGVVHEPYGREILDAARRHGVADRVRLIGPISEQEKYWYFVNCRAFAFPSVAEGFGLPVVEAMYHGKPVFLSRLTSLPEIGGDEAWYFDDFEPERMRQVLAAGLAEYDREQPVERIRARALRYSWPQAAAAYLRIYRSLRG